MEKFKLVLLSVDDWEVLYVNGVLFDQGHSVELERFFNFIIGREVFIESFEDYFLDDFDEDEFPEKLEEVVEYQKIKK